MKRLPLAAAALTLVLAGCSASADSTPAAGAGAEAGLLAAHDLAGMDATEIIDHLDRLGGADRPADLMASVRPDELLLSDGEQELVLAMPADRFYLSVAPYVDQTHECFYHSLTTCQGELTEENVQVRIIDDATGAVLVDEQSTTFDNGFVGYWLPRDVDGTIEVSHAGLTGTADFTTTDEGATCITSLQLA
ncbi:CueP family metal-binding protein [Georgenia sp. M64]|uniref:CueP family metal-binding protein n=1 Tax=Georgenia sp. M64 TaxID=3120520 RepID=UPI0030DE4173